MKLALLLLGPFALAVAAVALGLYWYGRRLSTHHRQTLTVDLPVPPQRVWEAIAESGGPGVGRAGQEITFVTESAAAPQHLVRRIVDAKLSFGGTWTFELEPQGSGTRLRLTEDGFIRSPLLRAITHLFIGLGPTMDGYLKTLTRLASHRS